jgi:putative acetyltransferase
MQRNGWRVPSSPARTRSSEVGAIRQASRQLVRELGALDDRMGVTLSQGHALIEIEWLGETTAGELAGLLNLDKSTTSRTIAALTGAGLVAARADSGDRRRRPLAVTAKGRRLLAALHRRADRQVEDALALLAPPERAAVVRGLSLYSRALARRRAQQAYDIRPIARRDDPAIASVLRAVLAEQAAGIDRGDEDDTLAHMSRQYRRPGHAYWVVTLRGQVVGGGGFAPLDGGDPHVCELRKMYFLSRVRGLGLGARLLALAIGAARAAGYRACYLETLRSMEPARRLYESFGFRALPAPMGATGHVWCDTWYLLELTAPPESRTASRS